MPEPWKILTRRTIYDSSWVRLHHLDLRQPDGQIARNWHLIDHPYPAVGILPIGVDGRILMIDHWRFTTQQRHWETPGGKVDPGESLIAAAARELFEETGHRAQNLKPLSTYHPAYGTSNLVFHVFLATGVEKAGEIADTNEVNAVQWFETRQVRSMMNDGLISDGMTLTGLLWYFLRRADADTA